MTVHKKANAKINLFLEVTAKRADGYHTLDSIMQAVSLADDVTVTAEEGMGITVTCSDGNIPQGCDNIAYRAAAAYLAEYGITAKVRVHIDKRIPAAAGLGGGSADAAAVITALDEIFARASGTDELCAIVKNIGADVPFCIRGGIARARGIGELFTACPTMPDCAVVIAIGDERASTAGAYGRIDALPERQIRSADGIIAALASGGVSDVSAEMFNIFEAVTEYDGRIKDIMIEAGAVGTMMSGSGTSVFGIFEIAADAENAARALTDRGYFAYQCRPIS